MSVYVTLLPSPGRRTDSYEDDATGETPVEYQHEVTDGGVLSVWRVSEVAASVLEVRYGPAAWESVKGTVRR